jgi:hypothetical protein
MNQMNQNNQNARLRKLCPVCNIVVPARSYQRHQDFHRNGIQTIRPTERLCDICNTPVSKSNFARHIINFHNPNPVQAQQLIVQNQARPEVRRLPLDVIEQLQIIADQRAMRLDENRINPEVINRFNNRAVAQNQQQGRRRVIPHLEGENDIDRERRMNRGYVRKFRDKVRQERGLPPPKVYNRVLVEGESQIDREKRLNRERVQKFRDNRKAQRLAQN